MALAAINKSDEAIEVYLKAIALHPVSVELLYNLGLVLQRQGDGPVCCWGSDRY